MTGDKNMKDSIGWLTNVPACDMNFKNHLKIADESEIEEAVRISRKCQERGNKTRIQALERELRRREKEKAKM